MCAINNFRHIQRIPGYDKTFCHTHAHTLPLCLVDNTGRCAACWINRLFNCLAVDTFSCSQHAYHKNFCC